MLPKSNQKVFKNYSKIKLEVDDKQVEIQDKIDSARGTSWDSKGHTGGHRGNHRIARAPPWKFKGHTGDIVGMTESQRNTGGTSWES